MEKILILDFGSQYTQLIARRVRELNIYCEIYPYNYFPAPDESVKGIILSGSPFSVHDQNHPDVELEKFIGKIPVLGVCYGAQLIAQKLGGQVERSSKREYGRAILHKLKSEDVLLNEVSDDTQVWMSHADTIAKIPQHFELIANSSYNEIAAFRSLNGNITTGQAAKPIYCFQFHPEVVHSVEGSKMLFNFCVKICGCKQDWTPASFIEETIKNIREKVGDEH